jgi:hypothetical protein
VPSDDRSDLGIFDPFVGHAWHIGVVEVDVETGKLSFLHHAAVHDAGTVVNPKTLNGQIIGGTIQGHGSRARLLSRAGHTSTPNGDSRGSANEREGRCRPRGSWHGFFE